MFPCQEAADRATIFNDGFSILQNLEQWRPKYLGQFTTEQEMLWAPGFATPLKEMRVNYVSSWTNNVCNFRKKRPHKEPADIKWAVVGHMMHATRWLLNAWRGGQRQGTEEEKVHAK